MLRCKNYQAESTHCRQGLTHVCECAPIWSMIFWNIQIKSNCSSARAVFCHLLVFLLGAIMGSTHCGQGFSPEKEGIVHAWRDEGQAEGLIWRHRRWLVLWRKRRMVYYQHGVLLLLAPFCNIIMHAKWLCLYWCIPRGECVCERMCLYGCSTNKIATF